MRLNIVSRWSSWQNETGLQDAVNVPASIPALVDLEKAGIPIFRTSDLLAPEDYQAAWEKSLLIVWQLIQLSRAAEVPAPNIIVVHGYSLFVLLAQVIIFEKFLERCDERYRITEITIEPPDNLENEPELYYGIKIYTAYFHDVARHWAVRRQISISEISAPPKASSLSSQSSSAPSRIAAFWKERRALPARIRRQFGRLVSSPVKAVSTFLSILRGKRNLVFYFPSTGAGLDLESPRYAIDAGLVSAFFSLRNDLSKTSLENSCPRFDFRVLFNQIDSEVLKALVAKRFAEHLDQVYGKGLSIYGSFANMIAALRRYGFDVAYLSSAPFVELHGYIAEAFRQAGCKIGAVQHGGNYRLVKRGGMAFLFSDLAGTHFFQWGRASIDEHAEYGIDHKVCFVWTGSPRTFSLLRKKTHHSNSRKTTRIRVLYAPSDISVYSSIGTNVVWDKYLRIVRKVCEILDASGLECTVKLLSTLKSEYFDLSNYRRLRFLSTGLFTDMMRDFDYLIVDSLGGSPIYESVVTDKPILLYAGIENIVWDDKFVEKLKHRVICFFDETTYIQGLREFVADPEKYVQKSRIKRTDDLVQTYMPPVSSESFWSSVYQAFWGNGRQKAEKS